MLLTFSGQNIYIVPDLDLLIKTDMELTINEFLKRFC